MSHLAAARFKKMSAQPTFFFFDARVVKTRVLLRNKNAPRRQCVLLVFIAHGCSVRKAKDRISELSGGISAI